jgi:aarF domain-containing kinase
MMKDEPGMVQAFRALGFKTKSESSESLVALGQSFFEAGGPEQRPYVDRDVMPEVNERMATILKQNPVTQIPGDILLIFRVLGLMSGLQKRLESRINMVDTILPYAEAQVDAGGAAAL